LISVKLQVHLFLPFNAQYRQAEHRPGPGRRAAANRNTRRLATNRLTLRWSASFALGKRSIVRRDTDPHLITS